MMTAAQVKALYSDEFRPLWAKVWGKQGLPQQIVVDGKGFDGTGGEDWVQIGNGVLPHGDPVVWYAIAHEMSHCVTPSAVRKLSLQWPAANEAAQSKLAEYAADLIGLHTLLRHLRRKGLAVYAELAMISGLLGPGDVVHPSGAAREALMRQYYENVYFQDKADFAELKRLLLGVFK